MQLAEPMEFVDLHHGQSMTLRIDAYQDGTAPIHPREITPRHIRIFMQQQGLTAPPPPGTPIYNEIPVLRVMGQRLDETVPTSYWDFSSKTLRADLLARLQSGLVLPITIQITANGAKPLKRYSVSLIA